MLDPTTTRKEFVAVVRSWLAAFPSNLTQLELYARPFLVKVRYHAEEDDLFLVVIQKSGAWMARGGGPTLQDALAALQEAVDTTPEEEPMADARRSK